MSVCVCVCVHLLVNNNPYSATTYDPVVESNSNKNDYQEYFLEVKAAGA